MNLTAEKVWLDLVWIDSGRMSGQPCIYGTRVPVDDLWQSLEEGLGIDGFIQAHPHIPRDRVERLVEAAKEQVLDKVKTA